MITVHVIIQHILIIIHVIIQHILIVTHAITIFYIDAIGVVDSGIKKRFHMRKHVKLKSRKPSEIM